MNQQQSMLDQMINERVSRAVERVFSQNKPEKIEQQIFAGLQGKIRTNSNQLRQTLYRKYNSLINCSQLLDGLSSFAKDLNAISQSMSKIISERQFEYQEQIHLKSKVQKIQYCLHKNKFQQAMKMLSQAEKQEKYQSENPQQDSYYFQYLKVQIVQKMEKYINKAKFDRNLIRNVINTLLTFVQQTQASVFKDIVNGRNKQLLNYLYSYVNQSHQRNEKISDLTIIQCLFQYKLTTLGYCNSETLILNFFYDLLELSQQNNDSRLKELFQQNWKQMGQNLSHIFIHRVQQPMGIKFEYQLYYKLVSSEQFLSLFQKIESNLGLGQDNHIIKSFQTLWQDYYHQLIDHITEQINPLNHIVKLQESSKSVNDLPVQFLAYKVDKSTQQSFNIRKKYKMTLSSIKNSMDLLCQKEHTGDILQLFKQKIKQVNQLICEYIKTLNKQAEQKSRMNFLQLRKAVLLIILCSDFNQISNSQASEITKEWAYQAKLSAKGCFEYLSELFNIKSKSFDCNMIELDSFFTYYTVPNLELKDLQIIQRSVMEILIILQIKNPQLSQRFSFIIKKLQNQKQPISIYKSSLPNIAQYVFLRKLSLQEIAFDNQTYKKYLKKSNKKRAVLVEERIQQKMLNRQDEDEFEIGEKETIEDMVQIGMKSMKTMGNFISGFMKKN